MVYGQSAGGLSTAMHLIHPVSNNMINSVAIHSNPNGIPCKENWEAKKQYHQFEETAQCIGKGINCLRNLSQNEVLEVLEKMPSGKFL